MQQHEFENINDAQLFLLKELLISGVEIQTRNFKTLELSPVIFSITNPRKRITTLKGRNWKFATALGELSWHLSMSNDLEFIANYLSGWKNYSADNKHIHGSCYGKLIFKKNEHGRSKWETIIELLKKDINSRRAVITLLDPLVELNEFDLDISCTVSLQFLVRNGKVDLIANMRSNDVIWGLPYDFFFFSFLQELMAFELSLPIGTYYHVAGSLHIYERHYQMAKIITSSESNFIDFEMPKLVSNELQVFLDTEYEIRKGITNLSSIENLEIDTYWKELLEVLYYFNNRIKDHMKPGKKNGNYKNNYFEIL